MPSFLKLSSGISNSITFIYQPVPDCPMEDAFPKLVRTTDPARLNKIPYPTDAGLDTLLRNVFSKYPQVIQSDFVEQGRVEQHAQGIVFRPETDRDAIISRQEVLQYFIDHPGLTDFVLSSRINSSRSDYSLRMFSGRYWCDEKKFMVTQCQQYLDLLSGLAEQMPESANREVQDFRSYLTGLVQGEEIAKLRNLLKDATELPSGLRLWMDIASVQDNFFWKGVRTENRKCTLALAGSEREIDAATVENDYQFDFHDRKKAETAYLSFALWIIGAVKDAKGKDLLKYGGTPATVELEMDYAQQRATCIVRYRELKLWSTMNHFGKPQYKDVEVRLNPNLYNKVESLFSNVVEMARFSATHPEMQLYQKDIDGPVTQAVAELRYLATVARWHQGLREKNVPLTTPKIAEMKEKATRIKGMLNPNLLSIVPLEKIVLNDAEASADCNLFTLTGPNNGGKTTYMNAIAIAQATGQAGWQVTAEDAELSPKDNIFTHYIRPGDLRTGESRYAHELSRIRELFSRATPYSLLLLDEVATGTKPDDGKREVDDIVKAAGRLGATTFQSTHYHNGVIETTNALPFARNLHCVVEDQGEDIAYTYKIAQGHSFRSEGRYLARKMGADGEGLIELLTARAARGEVQLRDFLLP